MDTGFRYRPEDHSYWLDERRLPSVTQVLQLLDPYNGVPAETLERKRELGLAVHRACELDDLSTLDESTLDPAIAPYLSAWRSFRADTGFTPTAIEERMYSKEHFYGGTMDRAGELAGALALLDIKCVSELKAVTALQLAAYSQLWLERHGCEPKHRFAVQLRPDGQYRCAQYNDRADRRVFLACLQLYQWRVGRGL